MTLALPPHKRKQHFLIRAKEVHGTKYLYKKVKYINTKTPVIITCKLHGDFLQQPKEHLQGYGCMTCGHVNTVSAHQRDQTWFLKRAKQVHGDYYDYSKAKYVGTLIPLTIICPDHGEFTQKPNYHLNSKTGCPRCIQSANERKIYNFLSTNNIKFDYEYPVQVPNRKRKLRFDFFLPDYQLLIEYDGEQHFRPVTFNGITKSRAEKIFEKTKQRDADKNKYAEDNNIKLVRILYHVEDIEKELQNLLYATSIETSTR